VWTAPTLLKPSCVEKLYLKPLHNMFRMFRRAFLKGPDLYVYHKTGLIAIVEVKTTTESKYWEGYLKKARKDLENYFESEEWKDIFKDARLGIPVALYLRDLDEIIRTEFKSGIEKRIGDTVSNPNFKP